ncbi:MAG: hypothetical protein U9Q34_07160, partial [Elusimicrobiota bacterium]|nr:hypothetical protein [Elusimicrobiota bacterium]
MKKNNFYREKYRPQFHFTAKKGWLNDPTGLVFYEGEYHLFYQYDTSVKGRPGKNMRWGHAVSRDLVRWKELPIALKLSKKSGQNYSGSSIVDYKNISGLGEKGKHPILLFFTKVKKNS